MDYQRENAKAERAELKQLIAELRTEIDRLRADSCINRRVLTLFIDSNRTENNAGDQRGREKGTPSVSQSVSIAPVMRFTNWALMEHLLI